MRRIVEMLGSMKITVGLLLVLLVVLATGTIIESTQSREAAAQMVYGANWFFALLGLFTLNLAASMTLKWPWTWSKVGFLITHGSMVVILVGSLMTEFVKVDSQLALWEGQTGNTLVDHSRHREGAEVPLGFTIRLDDFQIDKYPGTQRPAMFRSLVTITDETTKVETQHRIWMNHPLHLGGFKFFQSSYQMRDGREMSILSVSRDPGQTVVFWGYGLLVFGMVVVLVTRIMQRRGLPEGYFPESGPMKLKQQKMSLGLILALGLGFAGTGEAASVSAETLKSLHSLPVQHDGRVMPLDTMARESVLEVTGKKKWAGTDQVATVLGWAFNSKAWADSPIIKIGSRDLAAALQFPGHKHISFNGVIAAPAFRTLVDEGRRQAGQELPLTSLQEAALKLEGRLVVMHGFLTGQALRAQPVSTDPVDPWVVPQNTVDPGALEQFGAQLAAAPQQNYPTAKLMQNEVLYNAVRPTRLAWWVLLPATVLAYFRWRRKENLWQTRLTSILLIAGFAVMTWGLAMRWQAAGRIPASNMYESMLFLAWGVGLFAAIATLTIKNRLVIFNAAGMSTLVIMLTDLLPMNSFIHPMPPVLSGTPWLAIHVPIIMVSYALLALSAFVAHMRIGVEIFKPAERAMAMVMDEAHYWYVQIGSIMLIIGILTGSIWAASSWGRYWGWDPKEVWSLVAFLAYMAILHARIDRWIGGFGVAVASIAAFGTILMTYLGVNYVLAAGLHSYGFGGSKITFWLMVGAVVEAAFVGVGFWAFRRNGKQQPMAAFTPAPISMTVEPPNDKT